MDGVSQETSNATVTIYGPVTSGVSGATITAYVPLTSNTTSSIQCPSQAVMDQIAQAYLSQLAAEPGIASAGLEASVTCTWIVSN